MARARDSLLGGGVWGGEFKGGGKDTAGAVRQGLEGQSISWAGCGMMEEGRPHEAWEETGTGTELMIAYRWAVLQCRHF